MNNFARWFLLLLSLVFVKSNSINWNHRTYFAMTMHNVNAFQKIPPKIVTKYPNNEFKPTLKQLNTRFIRDCYKTNENVSGIKTFRCKANLKTLRTIRHCAKTSFTASLCRPFSLNSFKNYLFY